MKKIFSLILCVLLIMNILPIGTVFAAPNPSFELSDATAFAGDTVVLELFIKNNPGISTAYLNISYDRCLSLVSVQDTGLLNGALFENDITSVPYTLSWDDSLSTENNSRNGAVARLTFRVSENASAGEYKIKLFYDCEEVYDRNLKNVGFSTKNGTVSVQRKPISDRIFVVKNGNFFVRYTATVSNVIDAFSEDINFYNADGEKLISQTPLTSGSVAKLQDGTEYRCVCIGDCTGDGKISSLDARYALRASVSLEEPENWRIAACDTDNSGKITSSDARNILRASVLLDDPDLWFEEISQKENAPNGRQTAFSYEKISRYIVSEIENFVTDIDVSAYRLKRDEVKALWDRISSENPQLFYAEHVSIVYSEYVSKIHIGYTDNASVKRNKYEILINEIVQTVDKSWSDLEIILHLHDYLCANFEYDLGLNIYDPYNFLVKKTGVCQAYALTYMDLLQRFDIPVRYVTSDAMSHAWNVVQLDSEWYHVDVSWDDAVPDKFGAAQHNNFLLSDAAIADTYPKHKGWKFQGEAVRCKSTKYDNFFWNNVNSPFAYISGNWYYIAKSTKGYSLFRTRDFASSAVEKTLNGVWHSVGNSTWLGYYSGLGVCEGQLVYNNADTVFFYNPKTKSEKALFTENDPLDIYGIRVSDAVYYCLQSDPNTKAAKVFRLDVQKTDDFNEDGVINAKDYTLLIRYLNGYSVSGNLSAADFDRNNTINNSDAILLRKFIVNN